MSFYDDASLVFLPSGQAGKDGKAYSMKPIPEYGSELVTNGAFDTDSDWVKGAGWTISGGTANCDGSSNILRQSNAVPLNTKFYVSIEVSNYVSGALQVKFAPVGYPLNVTKNGIYTISTNGDNSVNTDLQIISTGFNGSIDNVSVKEVVVEDGDFTFTRGSNLTATRVDSNGLIEKGRENLLLQSNQFDTTWSTPSTDVTPNQSGYDGSTDAWLLEADVATSSANMNQSVSISGVTTASIYAKEGTTNWFRFSINDSGVNTRAWFDLSGSGAIGTTAGNIIDTNIESVGNGYFRCSITFNATAANLFLFIANADNSISYSVGDNIYIQDAQLEIGLTSTEYIESGASTGLAGILEDSPRFDYTGGASCPSLLLEPSRTNYLGYSEYFDGWNLFNNMTPTANDAISPEGFQNAYKMETTNVGAYFRDAQTLNAGDNVFSIFVKRGNSQYIFLRTRFFTSGDNADVWFDVQNGTKGGNLGDSVTYDIEDYENGWYRCYLVHNVDAGDLFGYAYVGLTNTDEDTSGESSLNGYFYGGQWEAGSYPTSYIPNHSGGSETREADGCDKDGFVSSGITTSSNFTFYMELEGLGQNNNPQVYLEDVSGNRILSLNLVGQKNRYGFYSPDASNYVSPSSNEADGIVKIAVTYDGTDFKEYFNGVEKGTRAASVTVGIDGINFNEIPSNSIAVHKAILFPTALSDADCITLTTL